jgi:hypothetical protein
MPQTLQTVLLIVALCFAGALAWARVDAAWRPPATVGAHRAMPRPIPDLPGFDPAERLAGAPRLALEVGGRAFLFAFVDKAGGEGWRIYILRHPPYGVRSDGGHETHRIFDQALGLHFICIHPDRQPVATPPEAVRFARMWAEGSVRYIDTGQAF